MREGDEKKSVRERKERERERKERERERNADDGLRFGTEREKDEFSTYGLSFGIRSSLCCTGHDFQHCNTLSLLYIMASAQVFLY